MRLTFLRRLDGRLYLVWKTPGVFPDVVERHGEREGRVRVDLTEDQSALALADLGRSRELHPAGELLAGEDTPTLPLQVVAVEAELGAK